MTGKDVLVWGLALALGQALAADAPETETRLIPPATGRIRVAFVLSPHATMIDFAGPWEVFSDVRVPGRGTHDDQFPFELYTVAESREPISTHGGMEIVPDYSFADAPQPRVIVVPAQGGSPGLGAWLKKAAAGADLTMSVCTGAFHLAQTGLLDGRKATTHHEFQDRMAHEFPAIDVQRGLRWVEGPRIATAGGLTSGIDLALRVVARYFGDPVAESTAVFMEHTSTAWRSSAGMWDGTTPEEAAREAERRRAAGPRPALAGFDPVLLVEGQRQPGRVDLAVDRGRYRYAFASEATRDRFLANPATFEIRHDGACAAMTDDGAPPGSGDPDRFLVHDAGIFIFATEACREEFARDAARER
jgi:putative intracellular protease/amidase